MFCDCEVDFLAILEQILLCEATGWKKSVLRLSLAKL